MRLKWLVTACVCVALFASACSSSSSGKGGSASTSTSTSTSTAKGTPFVIGAICDCTGPLSAVFKDTGKVATAWANFVNAKGGVNGHPVKMIVKNANQNQATALQDAKELVEQDHVMTIIDLTAIGEAYANYVSGKGIPVIGGCASCTVSAQNADFFPPGTTIVPLLTGAVSLATGKNLGVVYCAESPVCATVTPLATGIASVVHPGLKITGEKVAAATPSYTAQCLGMKSAGVDAMFVSDTGPIAQRVLASCAQQSFKPKNIALAPATSGTILKDPNFKGALVAGLTANPYDTSLPAVKDFQSELNKEYPGLVKSDGFAYDTMFSWSAGVLFEAAAKKGALTPTSTSAQLKQALYALKGDTLGGLVPPLGFTPGHPAFVPCWFTYKVNNGQFESLNNNKPTCLSAAQTTALVKVISS